MAYPPGGADNDAGEGALNVDTGRNNGVGKKPRRGCVGGVWQDIPIDIGR